MIIILNFYDEKGDRLVQEEYFTKKAPAVIYARDLMHILQDRFESGDVKLEQLGRDDFGAFTNQEELERFLYAS